MAYSRLRSEGQRRQEHTYSGYISTVHVLKRLLWHELTTQATTVVPSELPNSTDASYTY